LGDSVFLTVPPYVARLWEIGAEEDMTSPVPENFLYTETFSPLEMKGRERRNLKLNSNNKPVQKTNLNLLCNFILIIRKHPLAV